MADKIKTYDILSNLLLAINIAFLCWVWITGFLDEWSGVYSFTIIIFIIASWFHRIGWKRGFRESNKIHNWMSRAFIMTIKRFENNEFKKENFDKEFKKDLEITKNWNK